MKTLIQQQVGKYTAALTLTSEGLKVVTKDDSGLLTELTYRHDQAVLATRVYNSSVSVLIEGEYRRMEIERELGIR